MLLIPAAETIFCDMLKCEKMVLIETRRDKNDDLRTNFHFDVHFIVNAMDMPLKFKFITFLSACNFKLNVLQREI